MKPTIDITRASVSDFDTILRILSEVSDWLSTIGIDQWSRSTLPIDRIREQLDRGEVFLVRLEGREIGTVTLQWRDEPFWGKDQTDAGYIHRMALRPEYVGRNIGHDILAWAEGQTLSKGKGILRLNCLASNKKLRQFYESKGFRLVRIMQEPRGEACLYEKRLLK